jgi:hypothetical protein
MLFNLINTRQVLCREGARGGVDRLHFALQLRSGHVLEFEGPDVLARSNRAQLTARHALGRADRRDTSYQFGQHSALQRLLSPQA